jgi:hypothetical protein
MEKMFLFKPHNLPIERLARKCVPQSLITNDLAGKEN